MVLYTVFEGSIFLSSFITLPLVNILMIYPKNVYDIKTGKTIIKVIYCQPLLYLLHCL